MEKAIRISFSKIQIDITDILRKNDGTVSHYAVPLLDFLENSMIWLQFDIEILVPISGISYSPVYWFNENLGQFSLHHSFRPIPETAKDLKSISTDSLIITNNPKFKSLKNVAYLDKILQHKEKRHRCLIRHLKQVFYMCPRELVRKAKNHDEEAMLQILSRVKLYLSGLIRTLYKRYNPPGTKIFSLSRRETIDQTINEKILEAVSIWNERKLPIEKLAFVMVRAAFSPSSYKNYQADILDTELSDCPSDKRIAANIASNLISQQPVHFTSDKVRNLNKYFKKLAPLEKKVLILKLGLNSLPSLTYTEIQKLLEKEGTYSIDSLSKAFERAKQKLRKNKKLQAIWENQIK
jgi:hypothetical protein